ERRKPMVTQLEQHRVDEYLLKPLMDRFSGFNERFLLDWYEDFGEFSEAVLKETFIATRRKHKYNNFPKIGVVHEIAKEINSKPMMRSVPTSEYTGELKIYEDVADRVMKSSLGQLALEEGWGRSLYCIAKYEGKEKFNQSDIDKFRRDFDELKKLLSEPPEI